LHPEVTVALQVAPLSTDAVPSSPLGTYTVSVVWSTVTHRGDFPVGSNWGCGMLQPELTVALQVAASSTETVSSVTFAT
jgi:hypothetical protein